MITSLGEINVTSHATPGDWRGYPDEYRKHTARNHPAFTRILIECLMRDQQTDLPLPIVWDPQAGCGTTMWEADRLGYEARGWDIQPECRAMWPGLALEAPQGEVAAIVTSPWFPLVNHAHGGGDRQHEIREATGSRAGCESPWEMPPGHAGTARDLSHWMALIRPVIERCLAALAPGGLIAWIIRDCIREGRPAEVPELNWRLLERAGFRMLGAYWRQERETHNGQLRAKGHEKRHAGQGALPTLEIPKLPTIDRELALIGRRR